MLLLLYNVVRQFVIAVTLILNIQLVFLELRSLIVFFVILLLAASVVALTNIIKEFDHVCMHVCFWLRQVLRLPASI